MIEKSDEIKQTPTDVKSDAQKENWIEWVEVLNKYNELKEKVNLFSSNKQINE
jgi:glycine cleavage system H lipoate-binding protein